MKKQLTHIDPMIAARLTAALYNLVAGWVGGIKFELSDPAETF